MEFICTSVNQDTIKKKRLQATQPTFQDTIVNFSRISCQNESEKIKFFAVNNGSRLRAFIVAMNDDYVFYTGLTSAGANGYIHIRLQRPFQTLELASNRGLRKSVQLMEKEN